MEANESIPPLVMAGKEIIIDSRQDTDDMKKLPLASFNNPTSSNASLPAPASTTRTVYVALREQPHQPQILPSMQALDSSTGASTTQHIELESSLILQEPIALPINDEPKVIVQTLFSDGNGVVPSDLIPLSPGGGAGSGRLNNSQHIKFLPTEPVPYSQLSSQTHQLDGDSQIDSEEVMRIVAEQSSSHHQPLISLEPSPDFVLMEDVANIGKEGVLGPRISRDRHYSNLYEYSTSSADYVSEVVISEDVGHHPRRSDSASPTGSTLSSSGGSVSPPIQQQQPQVMESWPKKRAGRSNTARLQSSNKQVAWKLAAQSSTYVATTRLDDSVVESSPSPPTTATAGAKRQSAVTAARGAAGQQPRTRQISVASNISDTSSVNSNGGGDVRNAGKRKCKNPIPDMEKDDKYWRRRFKNNIAARRSREIKRLKEDELFKKADELEAKNTKLEQDLADALAENKRLKSKLSRYETQDEFCTEDIDDDDN